MTTIPAAIGTARCDTGVGPRQVGNDRCIHQVAPNLADLDRERPTLTDIHRSWAFLPMSKSRGNSLTPRVLIIAEAANPELASVPLVGWSHAEALARVVQAHLVTQVRNREAILRKGWREGIEFTAIDSERVAAPAHRIGSRLPGGWTTKMAVTAITYRYFEHLLWKRFQAELASGRWDIVHRITPLSPTVPSIIAKRLAKLGIPFVIGPLNGGVPWPKEFDSARRSEGEWLSYVRDVYKLIPGYRSTRRHASAIICGSKATMEQMPQWCRHKCHYMPENAIDPRRFSKQVEGPVRFPLRVAFVGRLVPYKCPDLLVEAAAPLIRGGKVGLDIIGDGPLMPRLRAMVKELGIETGVRLDGWVQHEMLQERLVESDVLGFPSIREFGGGVVLEAMALGLCPVVVDYGGPGELVEQGCGFKIPMTTRADLVTRFREILSELCEGRECVRRHGRHAREHVFDRFTWDRKAQAVADLYQTTMGLLRSATP
jgi:glycosyltransferase involved in cell wall biosynthesis